MKNLKLYTHDEMLNRVVGEKGTPRRDRLEAELQSYLIGEAIKQARKKKTHTRAAWRADGDSKSTGFKD